MTLNLAPMVDVMMCLIIFFLLAAKMVAAERHPIDLPWALSAREVDAGDLGARVTITVRPAAAQADQAEYVVADWNGEKIVDRLLLPEEIQTLLQSQALRAAREDRKIRCVIRADRMVMYRHVEAVLIACGLAGIRDVVFTANAGVDPEDPG